MTANTPLSHALLAALKQYGAAEIFGIPGDFALPFFKEIEATGILPLITLSHEPGLGFAADAAARYRSGLSVAAVTYGAGALNMVNPVAQAYAEKSPLVVVSGAPGVAEGGQGLLLHHQVKDLGSQMAIFRELTVAQARLDDPATAPAEIARVLSAAREFSRPVYLELPRDLVLAPTTAVPAYAPFAGDPAAAKACAEEIVARLKSAERPVLMLGVEVRRYGLEAEIAALARKLQIPTVTSFMGRGIMAADEAVLAGTYMGLAGDPGVRELVEGSDAILMLGVILSDTNFGVSESRIARGRIIHAFDRSVRFEHHVYPDLPLGLLAKALSAAAQPIGGVAPPAHRAYPSGLERDAAPITPDDVARAVNDLFAAKGRMPIASDIGDCLFTAMDISYTEIAAPAYYATMGPGVPMGLGLQAASGLRPLVLVGDGAFQMTGWELGNARRLGLTPIVLLFNNAAWGMLKVFQQGTQYNDLDVWDFAGLADKLGGVGRRVETRADLWAALLEAHADQARWRLIEIMLPKDSYSRTLNNFVAAQRRRAEG